MSTKPFLSVTEFAALTGLSEATIRRRIHDGSIRVFQPGGRKTRVLIPADALRTSQPDGDDEAQASDCTPIKPPGSASAHRGAKPRWRDELPPTK